MDLPQQKNRIHERFFAVIIGQCLGNTYLVPEFFGLPAIFVPIPSFLVSALIIRPYSNGAPSINRRGKLISE